MVWSTDIRWAIVIASRNHPDWTLGQIAAAVVPATASKVPCASTVRNSLDLFEETGGVDIRGQRGGPPGMPPDHVDALVRVVEAAPWAFLDEIAAEFSRMDRH